MKCSMCVLCVKYSHQYYKLEANTRSLTFIKGDKLLDIDSGRDATLRGVASQHYTFLFNAFVMMILFNEITARQIDDNPNVFYQLHRSKLFMCIWLASFIVQVGRMVVLDHVISLVLGQVVGRVVSRAVGHAIGRVVGHLW